MGRRANAGTDLRPQNFEWIPVSEEDPMLSSSVIGALYGRSWSTAGRRAQIHRHLWSTGSELQASRNPMGCHGGQLQLERRQ